MRRVFRTAEFAIALFGLFFMSGTLTSYLTPQGSETAPMVQVFGGALGLFAVISLLATRGAVSRILGQYWPAIVPVAFAILSLLWSVEFGLSLRRAGSLSLTTAFAFWLAFRFSPKELIRLLLMMAVCILLANFAIIQLEPARGLHQPYDLIGAQHAGSWRGLFGHKNDFGRLMAFTTAILTIAFVFNVGGRHMKLLTGPMIALAVLMIGLSNSSQAVLLVATVPAAVLVMLLMRFMTPQGRSFVIIIAVPLAIFSALSAQLIFEYVLALLGRDPTMTGRTIIWEGVILALGENAALGGGYGAGWQIVGPRLTALTGADVGHAHNGFLDLAVDVGMIGLGLTLIFMLWLGGIAFRRLMHGELSEISTLALAIVIFSLIGNVAGSFLLLHNNFYWVLLVLCFAKLREAPLERAVGGVYARPTAYRLGGRPV